MSCGRDHHCEAPLIVSTEAAAKADEGFAKKVSGGQIPMMGSDHPDYNELADFLTDARREIAATLP
jgi:hypothetical protein